MEKKKENSEIFKCAKSSAKGIKQRVNSNDGSYEYRAIKENSEFSE